MLTYLAKRILYVLPVALGVSLFCFLLVHIAPGDPLTAVMPPDASAELRAAGDRAFNVLKTAAEALCALLPRDGRPPALMMGLHFWAMAHGIASLFGRGDQARRKMPMTPEELLEAGVLVYLQGLGLGTRR